jgi:hypothetical protein
MASGILGQSNPTASTNTTVYTVPSAKTASCTVNICNAGGAGAIVTLAVAASGTPGASEYILYNMPLPAYGAIEKSGLVIQAAKNVVVNTTGGSVAVAVYGFEE